MDDFVSNVDNITFDVEIALKQQSGAKPLPFPGMDKSGSAVCEFYVRSTCSRGTYCPFRHVRGDKTIVCKHWLRGLCKKGDQCEFLHEYDMSKMPECYFYSRFSSCHNKECPFLHIDPESRIKDCPWYDRGFCRHGPLCRHRHVRRVMCLNYLAGFCPKGASCPEKHPRFEMPLVPSDIEKKTAVVTCHYCGEQGHKAHSCYKMSQEDREKMASMTNASRMIPASLTRQGFLPHSTNVLRHYLPLMTPAEKAAATAGNTGRKLRNLDDVVCFKCGQKGHYANRCSRGHLAFLSPDLQNNKAQLQMIQEERQQNKRGPADGPIGDNAALSAT